MKTRILFDFSAQTYENKLAGSVSMMPLSCAFEAIYGSYRKNKTGTAFLPLCIIIRYVSITHGPRSTAPPSMHGVPTSILRLQRYAAVLHGLKSVFKSNFSS